MPAEPPSATKETFRAELERLIHNFAAHEEEYTSPGYPEAQARTDFITPFFRALGWDVENRAGLSYTQREVLEEKGAGEGRPDYTFRIGALYGCNGICLLPWAIVGVPHPRSMYAAQAERDRNSAPENAQ